VGNTFLNMKINLDDMYVFSEVVSSGSYSKASESTGIAVSTISRRVSLLEGRLGVKLLNRTTRELKLTQAGVTFFESCQRIVEEAKKAERLVGECQSEPAGILRLSSYFSLDDPFISELITSCMNKHPKLIFDFMLQTKEVSLIEGGVDCRFQLGSLKDSSNVVRGLGSVDICYYASPGYLVDRGCFSDGVDLSLHRLINFKPHSFSGIPKDLLLETDIVCQFETDDILTARQMALGGAGITRLPAPHAKRFVDDGLLVKVLDNRRVTLPLNLVLGNHRELTTNLRAFVDHFIEFTMTNIPWNPL